MLRLDLCDYSDAHIVVKGTITVKGNNVAKTRNKKVIFKNPFSIMYIKKSIAHSETMQKILMLSCQYIIY